MDELTNYLNDVYRNEDNSFFKLNYNLLGNIGIILVDQ